MADIVVNLTTTEIDTTVTGDTVTVNIITATGSTGVTSFNGRTGVVVPATDDYTADQITETASRIFFSTAEETKLAGIEAGAEVNQTDAEIKTQYENNADTNAYTDAEKSKLGGIEAGAEVNNISDANATALTDGGSTTLHGHPDSKVADPSVTTLTITTGQTSFTASDSARRFFGDLGSGTALEFTSISGLTNGGEPVKVVIKTTGAGISYTWPSTPVTSGTAPAGAGYHEMLIFNLGDGTLGVRYLTELS